MPFQFKKSEPPAQAVSRVFAERMDAACGLLDEPHRPKVIHQVRKEVKKLRSVLRLVRGELAPRVHRKIQKPLRRAAERLAPVRDARVKFQALAKLVEKPQAAFPLLYEVLRKNWKREMKRLNGQQATSAVVSDLHKARRRMDKLKMKTLDWRALAYVFQGSHEEGREQFLATGRKPLAKNFHSWRKRVKTQWYQLCLLPSPRPQALRRLMEDLEELGELLGVEHDLHLLAEFIEENARGAEAEVQTLAQLIAVRRKRLRVAAFKLGARIYAKEPNVWMQK